VPAFEATRRLRRTASLLFLVVVATVLVPAPTGARTLPVAASARIVTVSQHDLLSRGAALVSVTARRSGTARLSARLEQGGRRVLLGPGRTVRLRRGARRMITFTLTAAARDAIGRCEPQRIVVSAVGSPKPRKAGAGSVRLDPPRCGRFFGPQTVWNAPLAADAPLDPASAQVTGDLVRQVDEEYQSDFQPTINTARFSSPVYTVAGDQPTVRVTLDKPRGQAPAALEEQFTRVPLPADALPAAGSDGHALVWQPATDTMWEFWKLRRAADGWHASWGGRLDSVSTGPGHFAGSEANFGATATSLPLAGGLMTVDELRSGRIDHALAIALPDVRAGVAALPAQRSDGRAQSPAAAPSGAHFRLDPSLDVESLGLPPVTLAMARAAQRYGIVVRDGSANVTFYGEDPTPSGTDPYPAIFGGQRPSELLRTFPWRSLQLLAMDLRPVRTPASSCRLLLCR